MYFLSKQQRLEAPGTWIFLWLLVPVAWVSTAVKLTTDSTGNSILAGFLALITAGCIAGLYASAVKDTWYDRCHLSGAELMAFRNAAERNLNAKEKAQSWEQLVSVARSITTPDDPDFHFALLATIYIQEKRTSDYWVPAEAKKYIRQHPIENHIIRRAWNPL